MNHSIEQLEKLEPKEIERKFLLKLIPPNLRQYPCDQIRQGYLFVDHDREVRIRQKGEQFFRTEKIGQGTVRGETENTISQEEFDQQWPLTYGRQITKTRHKIPYQGLIIELDIYQDSLSGLIVAEVEFPSVEAAKNFTPPDWFGQEVTEDLRYKNRTLATDGLPKN